MIRTNKFSIVIQLQISNVYAHFFSWIWSFWHDMKAANILNSVNYYTENNTWPSVFMNKQEMCLQ